MRDIIASRLATIAAGRRECGSSATGMPAPAGGSGGAGAWGGTGKSTTAGALRGSVPCKAAANCRAVKWFPSATAPPHAQPAALTLDQQQVHQQHHAGRQQQRRQPEGQYVRPQRQRSTRQVGGRVCHIQVAPVRSTVQIKAPLLLLPVQRQLPRAGVCFPAAAPRRRQHRAAAGRVRHRRPRRQRGPPQQAGRHTRGHRRRGCGTYGGYPAVPQRPLQLYSSLHDIRGYPVGLPARHGRRRCLQLLCRQAHLGADLLQQLGRVARRQSRQRLLHRRHVLLGGRDVGRDVGARVGAPRCCCSWRCCGIRSRRDLAAACLPVRLPGLQDRCKMEGTVPGLRGACKAADPHTPPCCCCYACPCRGTRRIISRAGQHARATTAAALTCARLPLDGGRGGRPREGRGGREGRMRGVPPCD